MEYTLRQLEGNDEFCECLKMQGETWGGSFSEHVPPSMLMLTQKLGGVTAGAFNEQGEMVGFVYGMTGPREGRLVHWSHMLAVRKDWRGKGIGEKLKRLQRSLMLEAGVGLIQWTFDPLVSRNAHINLNRLGAVVHEYLEDVYPESDSPLHAGLGTDRFVVAWHIKREEVARRMAGERFPSVSANSLAPVVNARSEGGIIEPAEEAELPDLERIRVEVPENIQIEKGAGAGVGFRWRRCTRRAFLHYLGRGYKVEGFYRDDENRAYYVLNE